MPESQTSRRIEELMRQRRFDEAVSASRAWLDQHPEDLEALLRMGICCLLSRAEDEFERIHARAAELVRARPQLSAPAARLWQLHQSLLARIAAPLLVLGSTALPACERTPVDAATPEPTAAPSDLPTTADETATALASAALEETVAKPEPTASAAAAEVPDQPGTAQPATGPKPPVATQPATGAPKPPTYSAHRYSAGVYRPPNPATHHKYSGGVYRPGNGGQ